MGSDSVRNGIFIATNQRLLFYAKKLTGYDFESFPHEQGLDGVGKNLMGHYIMLLCVQWNSAKMKWISAGDVRASRGHGQNTDGVGEVEH